MTRPPPSPPLFPNPPLSRPLPAPSDRELEAAPPAGPAGMPAAAGAPGRPAMPPPPQEPPPAPTAAADAGAALDRKSTRLNSSHQIISYAVFCLKKKKQNSVT